MKAMERDRDGAAGPVERILALYRLPAFHELGPANVALLARHVRERRYRKGEVVWLESEAPSALLVIVKGEISIRSWAEREYIVGPGQAIGAQGLFVRVADGISATVLSPVLALELPVQAMREIMEDNFEILLHTIRLEAMQLLEAMGRLSVDRVVPNDPVEFFWEERDEELDLVERILVLRQLPEFAEASVDAIAEVARNLEQVHFESGETLYCEGDDAGPMYFLLDGEAQASRRELQSTLRYRRGAAIGVLHTLSGGPRLYTVLALTGLTVLRCRVGLLLDAFEDNFEMAVAFIAALTRQRGAIEREAIVFEREAG